MERKSSFSCHLQQLLQKAGKRSICSAGKLISVLFSFFFNFYPQWDPFLRQHRAAPRLAEPLLGHPNLNAALQACQQSLWWGNLTWHFSNPVHCGLPFQLSGTVIEHHIANLKRSCGDSGGSHVQCCYTTGIKLKGLKWLKGSSLQWLLWYRAWLKTTFLSQPILRKCHL